MKLRNLVLCICGFIAAGAFFILDYLDRDSQEIATSQEERIAASHKLIATAVTIRQQLKSRAELIEAARHAIGTGREIIAEIGDNSVGEETDNHNGIVQGKVEKGATLADVLGNAGNGSINHYVNAAARVFPLRYFRAGQPYTVLTDPVTGRIMRFEYEINDKNRLIVEGDEHPRARTEEIKYLTLLETCEGTINDSLFQAVADIGESPQLALRLVDLFGSEINFIRNIQTGDRFAVLIEKRFRQGEYKGYGRILAARFTNKGKTYEAWLYRDLNGELQYYNSAGENLKKALLMSPLAVTRLTSKFTHARKHPILGGTRPHLGVDYAAPTGTPVKAVGSGIVTKRGWAGGYGNQIILQHGAELESMYAHLSGFARGLKLGQKVRQGQVIGFVGSTGLSTGPHLDFRLRQRGQFINPSKAINPRWAAVDPGLMANFRKVVAQEKALLEGGKLPTQYALDSIVPLRVSSANNVVAKNEMTARKLASRKTGLRRQLSRRGVVKSVETRRGQNKEKPVRKAEVRKPRKKRS